MFESINPATGVSIARHPLDAPAEVERRLATSAAAFLGWSRASFRERAQVLEQVARLLVERREPYARLMAQEMGKPLAQGVAEAEKCAWVARHYAAEAETLLAPEPVPTEARWSGLRFEPLGPVLAVMPWNFPFWQVLRAGAPTLMAGNTLLLKHAPSTPGCALALEQLFRDAGAPDGVFVNLVVDTETTGAVIDDPRVRAVTLTGSVRAGSAVAARAGAALKKCVLELGGSDPFVVLADADVEAAARVGALARLQNSGQSCIAAKRFIVEAGVAERFTAAFVAHVEAAVVGDPLVPATAVGPLARADLRTTLAAQVEATRVAGGRCLVGGRALEGPGFFYAPTVFDQLPADAPLLREETFGPVAAIVVADDLDAALRIANDSPFGLAASIWSRDEARVERLVRGLEVGAVFVNGMSKSDPRLPFGGVKLSGIGRELGREGIREFVNAKTVVVA